MSGLFKTKKTELPAPREITAPAQAQGQQYLSRALQDYEVTPYSGQLSSTRPSFEGQIPGLVQDYASRGQLPLITSAQNQLQQTIEGKYDPRTSPYYQSFRDEALRNLDDTQTNIRQSAQLGGALRTSGRVRQEARAAVDTSREINSVLGQLYEQERLNQLNAIPQALNVSDYVENAPNRTLATIMGAGGYLTAAEQAELDRTYNDFLRQGEEKRYGYSLAETLASPSLYNYYQPTYDTQASPFERYISPLIQTAMMAAATAAGGGGAAAGAVGNTGKTQSQILGFNTAKYR